MHTSIRYIFLTALRDWLFLGLMTGVLFAAGISAVLGGTAFLEEKEMTLVYAAGSARLILMVGLIVFVCFHIRQAFDSKEIDVVLSRPISRASLVVAYWLGFSAVALLLVLPIIAIVGALGVIDAAGYAGWALSLLLEAWLVIAFALFSAFALRSAVASVMASMGFYVLSRMMAFFIVTSQSGLAGVGHYAFLKHVLTAVSTLVPRLDFFSKTQWLVYGFDAPREFWLFVIQAGLFIPLLLLAAVADLRRKEF